MSVPAKSSTAAFVRGLENSGQSKRRRRNRRRFACSLERMEERVVMTIFFPTTTTLSESMTSGAIGSSVTFTATVTAPTSVPTNTVTNGVSIGSVTFEDGSNVIGTGTVVGGVATLSTSALAVGVHNIVAYYGGAGSYTPSASAGLFPDNTISTVAGNGTSGFSGNGGQATSAQLQQPIDVAFDSSGDMFIADSLNHVVREVTPSGIISTYAGTGTSGNTGDGGPASSAELEQPGGLAFNAAGDLFIADISANVVREVTPSGVISTAVGTGTYGYTGDGGPATSATLGEPFGIAFNAAGDLFIADSTNNVIREVNTSGVISTVAGNHTAGYSGNGGPATSAELYSPLDVAFNAAGDMFIADYLNNVVREVNLVGVISTVAGNTTSGHTGDGGPATTAELHGPISVKFDSYGNMFIAETFNNDVREVNALGVISTLVGTGTSGYTGNGGPASAATLDGPQLITIDSHGNLFIADFLNNAIREVAATPPVTYTVTQTAVSGSPSLVGLSRYPVHNNRTLVSLFFDQTLNPAEALWKHNYQLHTKAGSKIKISYIYLDPSTDTVTLLPHHRLALRSTYTIKLLGSSSHSSKGSSPTVTPSGWLASSFKAKIDHKALSAPGAPPAITFVNGQEVARRS